ATTGGVEEHWRRRSGHRRSHPAPSDRWRHMMGATAGCVCLPEKALEGGAERCADRDAPDSLLSGDGDVVRSEARTSNAPPPVMNTSARLKVGNQPVCR